LAKILILYFIKYFNTQTKIDDYNLQINGLISSLKQKDEENKILKDTLTRSENNLSISNHKVIVIFLNTLFIFHFAKI
jgi:hypothetical protein